MIERINKSNWGNFFIVQSYYFQNDLFKAEKILFKQFNKNIEDKKILDIGIGIGRTTKYLSKKTKTYTGIDYSEKMINTAKTLFPKLNLKVMDAKKLDFPNNSFDFVLFSFNGIDCVDLNSRITIFKEIHRVLKKNGIFMFSFHNYLSYNKKSPTLKFTLNPLLLIVRMYCFLVSHFNINRYKKYEIKEKLYGMFLDGGGGLFNLVNFYIIPTFQKQLLSKLFKTKLYDTQGNIIINKKKFFNKENWMIYAICQKKIVVK